jgi:hypothetical protein
MKKTTLLEKIHTYSLIPFSMMQLAYRGATIPDERNAIKQGKPVKGIKRVAFSKDISVSQVKEKC